MNRKYIMKRRFLELYKWTSLISLILIPYYIHSARIDRILNNYTQKSNAIYLIVKSQKSTSIDMNRSIELIHSETGSINHLQIIIFYSITEEFKSISRTRTFYINSDIPPPPSFV